MRVFFVSCSKACIKNVSKNIMKYFALSGKMFLDICHSCSSDGFSVAKSSDDGGGDGDVVGDEYGDFCDV